LEVGSWTFAFSSLKKHPRTLRVLFVLVTVTALVEVLPMPVEKWSDTVAVAHLADDPQFTEDVQCVHDTITAESRNVVLDFAGVHFLNSSNLAKLLHLRKLMNSLDRRLVLCSISNAVRTAFLVTGLSNVFDFSDNVPTALATLQIANGTTPPKVRGT
jgi:anti-anti-sigma factor